jgi:hypothetical protein
VIAISEALNLRIWVTNVAAITHLNGIFCSLPAFLSSVLTIFGRSWPVLITLLGWIVIFGGLFRMFAPEAQQTIYTAPILPMHIIDVVLLAIGLYLTFEAYGTGSR